MRFYPIPTTIEDGQPFKLPTGEVYAKHKSGAIVRLDRFRGSKKERRRAKRASALEKQGAK